MKSIQDKVETLFHETLNTQLKDRVLPFRIIAAFSGGPDSTALLFLLKRFQKDFGYDLEAAYVNHGIRPLSETSVEDKSVKKLTHDLKIPLHIKKLSSGLLKQYASRKHCGLEGAARLFRYRFFNKILALAPQGSVTALGHNRNDQEETIIMRLFSGAGLDGLKGIPESRETLIRPLIHIDRDSLIQYLEFNNLPVIHDSSNFEKDYLRNKIRLDLMDRLHEIFPEGPASLLRLGDETSSVLNHYNLLLEDLCPWSNINQTWVCREVDFLKLPFVSRRNVVIKRMNHLIGSVDADKRIPRNFFSPLEDLGVRKKIILKGRGILFSRKKGSLILEKEKKLEECTRFFFYLTPHTSYKAEHFSLEIRAYRDILPGDPIIPLPPGVDSLLIRSPGSQTETGDYSKDKNECLTILNSGKNVLSVLNSRGKSLYPGTKYKKRLENDGCTNHLCVIIIFRGIYAPG